MTLQLWKCVFLLVLFVSILAKDQDSGDSEETSEEQSSQAEVRQGNRRVHNNERISTNRSERKKTKTETFGTNDNNQNLRENIGEVQNSRNEDIRHNQNRDVETNNQNDRTVNETKENKKIPRNKAGSRKGNGNTRSPNPNKDEKIMNRDHRDTITDVDKNHKNKTKTNKERGEETNAENIKNIQESSKKRQNDNDQDSSKNKTSNEVTENYQGKDKKLNANEDKLDNSDDNVNKIVNTTSESSEFQPPKDQQALNSTQTNITKPNIIFILVDDMGWNDVSFHGSSQILTPNIDALAYDGVILDQYYTDAAGTASRSGILSGVYPMRLGTQGPSILASEDRGLSNETKLLPKYLKSLGYKSHFVGKWQLGKSRTQYLPTNKGFDSFYGFLDGSVDYYTYNLVETVNGSQLYGLDLYDNDTPDKNAKGHITDLLTERTINIIQNHDKSSPLYVQLSHAAPHAGGGLVNLQPTQAHLERNAHIAHPARRMYASLVTHLDDSIGRIVTALSDQGILNDTLIIFSSDNGAALDGDSKNFGSNFPFRGGKNSPFEGGLRSPAFIWHSELNSNVWNGFFHVTDWLPTILSVAGSNVTSKIDGVDQWESISQNKISKRFEALLALDDINGWATLRNGDFKIIIGNVSKVVDYQGVSNMSKLLFRPPKYGKVFRESNTVQLLNNTLGVTFNFSEIAMKRRAYLKNVNNNSSGKLCFPTNDKGCLFNIRDDPNEINDLWKASSEVLKVLTLRLRTLWSEIVPRSKPVPDLRCDPSLYGYVWSPWLENDAAKPRSDITAPSVFPLRVSRDEVSYVMNITLSTFSRRVAEALKNMSESFLQTVGGLFDI